MALLLATPKAAVQIWVEAQKIAPLPATLAQTADGGSDSALSLDLCVCLCVCAVVVEL